MDHADPNKAERLSLARAFAHALQLVPSHAIFNNNISAGDWASPNLKRQGFASPPAKVALC